MPASERDTAQEALSTTPHTAEKSMPPSIWLYFAGLIVTLSGLFAVNFQLEASNFPLLTYLLATVGYVFSYFMRMRGISLRSLQTPFLLCLSVLIFLAASSERGLEWFLPPEAISDRAKALQMVFVWLAILHSFTLTMDAAVLFSCVPCMTMIALVSTTESAPEVQNSFLVFIGAATFLMVHENYLRTRHARLVGRSPGRESRFFGGQVQLAAFCVVGALILANYVAIPIRSMGQLFLPTAFNPLSGPQSNRSNTETRNVQVTEDAEKMLATGPQRESNLVLMRVTCERSLYWRGSTFDEYTGISFRNTLRERQILSPSIQDESLLRGSMSPDGISAERLSAGGSSQNLFQIPNSPTELPSETMENANLCRQEFTIEGGAFTYLYGANKIEQVRVQLSTMRWNANGGLVTSAVLPLKSQYAVLSRVADDDPERLRKATTGKAEYPEEIQRLYLQKNGESIALTQLAQQITKSAQSGYEKAEAIRSYIAQNCKYNLQTPAAPRDRDIVEYFLTESKMGYCDSFAAAMTMLARYAGLPARLVSGFLPGEMENGQFVVREKHKHMWSEVFFPKVGWVVFDATDGSEDISDHSGLDKKRNKGFLGWLLSNGWLPPILGGVCLALVLFILKTEVFDRLRPRKSLPGKLVEWPATNLEIIQTYLSVCGDLARRGLPRNASMTPNEYWEFVAQTAAPVLPALQEPMKRLTAIFMRYRYSTEVATPDDVQDAKAQQAQIASLLQKTRRGVFSQN